MEPVSLLDYREFDDALSKTALKMHPSEAHGLLCGIFCNQEIAENTWENLVAGDDKSEQLHQLMQLLYETSAQQLTDFLFEFQLLLPDEDEALQIRAEALMLWCQGFLTGLKIANVAIEDRKPSDMTEAINDLIEIASVNYEDVVTCDEDEAAYIELVEYVRMAVIFIYQAQHEENMDVEACIE